MAGTGRQRRPVRHAGLRLGDKLEDAADRITTMDVDGYYIIGNRENGVVALTLSHRIF